MPPNHPDSNERLGRQALLERVGAANAVYPMRCDEGLDAYQLRLGEIGQLDVIHLGLGPDGSIAVALPELAGPGRRPRPAGDLQRGPQRVSNHLRMTLTYAGIARARLAIFTVDGEAQRHAMEAVWPARTCRPHASGPGGSCGWSARTPPPAV